MGGTSGRPLAVQKITQRRYKRPKSNECDRMKEVKPIEESSNSTQILFELLKSTPTNVNASGGLVENDETILPPLRPTLLRKRDTKLKLIVEHAGGIELALEDGPIKDLKMIDSAEWTGSSRLLVSTLDEYEMGTGYLCLQGDALPRGEPEADEDDLAACIRELQKEENDSSFWRHCATWAVIEQDNTEDDEVLPERVTESETNMNDGISVEGWMNDFSSTCERYAKHFHADMEGLPEEADCEENSR